MRGWATNNGCEPSIVVDAEHLCVQSVGDTIAAYVSWNNDGMTDISATINITNNIQVFRNKSRLAWKCPVHKVIEEIDLMKMATVKGVRTLHFKYHVPDYSAALNPPIQNGILLKFYPNKQLKTPLHSFEELGSDRVPPGNRYMATTVRLRIVAEGNVQDPQVKTDFVADVSCIAGLNTRFFRFKCNAETGELECPYIDGEIINMDELKRWVREKINAI